MPKKPGFNLPPTYAESRRIWRNKVAGDKEFAADMEEARKGQQKTDSMLRGFKTMEALLKFQKDNARKLKKADDLRKEQKRLELLKKSG